MGRPTMVDSFSPSPLPPASNLAAAAYENKPAPRTLRVMIASADAADRRRLTASFRRRCSSTVVLEVASVPEAMDAMLTRHPDVLVTGLQLPGHPDGGLRAVLEAASLGVRTVLRGARAGGPLADQLRQLGVDCLPIRASADEIASFVERSAAAADAGPGVRATRAAAQTSARDDRRLAAAAPPVAPAARETTA